MLKAPSASTPQRVLLEPKSIEGVFEGELDGRPVHYTLGGNINLDRPIEADERRGLQTAIVIEQDGRQEVVGGMIGTIPRPFLDWFEAPMDEYLQQELHRKLGKYHELAMVFTWVAGLLNLLAIWDAVEGPAYGYGDEVEETSDVTEQST